MLTASVTAFEARACRVDGNSSASTKFKERLRAFLEHELATSTRIRIPRNGHVFNCGDRDADLYLVESGQVKTSAYSQDGKQCLLSIYAAGDVFGELCQSSAGRSETATAMRPTILWRIPFATFRAALVDQELLEAFLGYLTIRLSEQQQIITNMVTMDSERRLAAALLILADKIGKRHSTGTCIEQRITQEELSGMVGTTRSRIGYFLKRFSEAGLISRLPGAFLVVNEHGLSHYLQTSGGV